MNYLPGLVSITFRKLSADDIISLVAQAGQKGIEWGGDVHVPPGDLDNARRVCQLTRAAGLQVAAYGSYYRCGEQQQDKPTFDVILETAVALEAPSIRVWAGGKSPADCTPEEVAAIKDDFVRICRLAREHNILIATEFHGHTLTETRESTQKLFEGITEENARSLWQPHQKHSMEDRLATIDDIADRLLNVHMFQWGDGGFKDRRPLAEGEAQWKAYLQKIGADGRQRWALLEFVAEDEPENYLRDAETLNRWLGILQ